MVIEISDEERLPSKNEAAHLTETGYRNVDVVRIDWQSRTAISLNSEHIILYGYNGCSAVANHAGQLFQGQVQERFEIERRNDRLRNNE